MRNDINLLITCVLFVVVGAIIGFNNKPAVTASSPPSTLVLSKSELPVDLQLDLQKDKEERPNFEITVSKEKPDTVYRYKTKYKTKIRKVGVPKESVDSLVRMRADSLATLLVREEQTKDTISHSKGSIILTVDGEEVYKR